MVLSLPLVLALVGSATGLIIGMLIFGEVSDALVCPTAGGGGGNFTSFQVANNLGSLGSSANGRYYENNNHASFNNVPGRINEAVYQEGTSSLEDQGEIRFGTASQWDFLHRPNSGSNITSINFWIKGDVDGAPEYPIFGTQDGTNTNIIYFSTTGSSSSVIIRENGVSVSGDGIGATRPPDDSQWHMLSIVMDKGTSNSTITASQAFGFGWYNSCRFFNTDCNFTFEMVCLDTICDNHKRWVTNQFNGLGASSLNELIFGDNISGQFGSVTENSFALDDITIWQGYQLTQTDIVTLYNSGSGSSAGATGSSIALANQVLHVPFDTGTFATGSEGSMDGDGEGETGSEQCLQAKDTAWTVIAILPVALFFGLFAIFSSLGVTRPT